MTFEAAYVVKFRLTFQMSVLEAECEEKVMLHFLACVEN